MTQFYPSKTGLSRSQLINKSVPVQTGLSRSQLINKSGPVPFLPNPVCPEKPVLTHQQAERAPFWINVAQLSHLDYQNVLAGYAYFWFWGVNKTLFTHAKKSTQHAKFLALCLNHFGTSLPIYTTHNKRFFSSCARLQFLIGKNNTRIIMVARTWPSVLFPGNSG